MSRFHSAHGASPEAGDADGLIRYLGAAGLPAEQLLALRAAIDADTADAQADPDDPDAADDPGSRWTRTRAWFAGAATDVGTGALGSIVATAGQAFLG